MINNKIIYLSTPTTVDMADEWYEFALLDHFWIQGRFKSLLKLKIIKNLTNVRLLEIGCGNGVNIKQFETLSDVVVDGCDLNLVALKKVDRNKGSLFLLDIFDKPPELLQKYDGTLLMDVIEHIHDDSRFLNCALEYLKENGLVIINVPAFQFLFSKYDTVNGHKRRYTKNRILDLFKKNNIELIHIGYWGFLLIPILIMRKFILFFQSNNTAIKKGFQPPLKVVNWFLNQIINFENLVFPSSPFGTSIIAIGKKNHKEL